jgi:hypothetical protein
MFMRSDLDELLTCDSTPAVSIYLPTHQAGREVRQDAIRLRNLLSAAAKRLSGAHRGTEVARLLDPAQRLVDDGSFWRYQDRGLAIFLAPDFDRVHKLPVEVAEELTISRDFHIRPLLPLVDPAAWFWVLTVTAGRTGVYQGSRWSFDEFPVRGLPQGIQGILDETVYEEAHNASPTGRPQRSGAPGLAKAQAFGPAPDELHKDQLIELLHRVAAAVEPVVKGQPAPVILAAQPEVQGHLREFLRWKELLPESIQENPDAMAPEALHRKAWRLIEPRLDKGRADALGRLHALLGTADGRATTTPAEIVKSAHYGRVEQLFLARGEMLWGRFIESEDRIEAHASPAEGDEELFDCAARMTLRQGGTVTLVDRAQLPPNGSAAATLRY